MTRIENECRENWRTAADSYFYLQQVNRALKERGVTRTLGRVGLATQAQWNRRYGLGQRVLGPRR